MNCKVCGLSCFSGAVIYRTSPKGEKFIGSCWEHLTDDERKKHVDSPVEKVLDIQR
jgi:hypothetical protein